MVLGLDHIPVINTVSNLRTSPFTPFQWDSFIDTICQRRTYVYSYARLGGVCWLNAGVEDICEQYPGNIVWLRQPVHDFAL